MLHKIQFGESSENLIFKGISVCFLIGVYVFFRISVFTFFLDVYSGMDLFNHMIVLFLVF